MGCDIHYTIERRDIQNNWHLVKNSESIWSDIKTGKDDFNEYMEHPAVLLRSRNYALFSEFSNVRGKSSKEQIMEAISVGKIDKYDFNPLTKYYLNEIANNYDYHSLGYSNFEHIINSLNMINNLHIDYYKEAINKSLNYFSSLEIIRELNTEDVKKDLKSIISNHHYLELLGAKFEPMNLANTRMIVYYDN